MRIDPRSTDGAPGALEQLRDSPARALVMAITAGALCVVGIIMVLATYSEVGRFPWYEAGIPAVMLVVAVVNVFRFVHNRRKSRGN